MDIALRIVTRLPLQELWRDDGFTTTLRLRWLTAEDIASLLLAGRVQFVVADIGYSPRWIPLGDCYDFWKSEAQLHLAAPETNSSLNDFPDGYCYFASEWNSPLGITPIVVFEKSH